MYDYLREGIGYQEGGGGGKKKKERGKKRAAGGDWRKWGHKMK